MKKVDLHTHSIISHDGGIDEAGYQKILEKGVLDCVAITDHNEISFAQKLHAKLGEKIIVAEEIDTIEGQLIGLFLKSRVSPGLTARETALAIRKQGGLVCVPHPFEKLRAGLSEKSLAKITDLIDIVEVFNSRTIEPGKSDEAHKFAKAHNVATASSSDAHGYYGLGGTYSILSAMPTKKTLKSLLAKATYQKQPANLVTRLTPRLNKARKWTNAFFI